MNFIVIFLSLLTGLSASTIISKWDDGSAKKFIGYDCSITDGSTKTISGRQEDCAMAPITNQKKTISYGQILYRRREEKIKYQSCYIHTRTYFDNCDCVLWVFCRSLRGGEETSFEAIDSKECQQIIKSKKYKHPRYKFEVLLSPQGEGISENFIIAGKDNCITGEGGKFTTKNGRTLENIVAWMSIEIRVSEGTADAIFESNEIRFYDGSTADFSDGEAMHSFLGKVFWDPSGNQNCDNDLVEIYAGPLSKIEEILHDQSSRVSYHYKGNDREFFIEARGELLLCDNVLISTQSTSLFLNLAQPNGKSAKSQKFKKLNLELVDEHFITSISINSLEHRLGTQVSLLAHEIRIELCKYRNKQVLLKNNFEKKGFVALLRGEVYYLKKCAPQLVQFRKTSECYSYLPVNYNNEDYFLIPHSKLLTRDGLKIPCSHEFPAMFFIDGIWYKVDENGLQISNIPVPISQLPELDFEFKYSDKLAETNILTEKQRIQSQKAISYHLGRDPVSEAIILSHQSEEHKLSEGYFQKLSFKNIVYHVKNFFYEIILTYMTICIIIATILILYILYKIYRVASNFAKILNAKGISFSLLKSFNDASTERIIRDHELKELDRKIHNRILNMKDQQVQNV